MKEHEVSHKDSKESKEREKLKRPDMKAKNLKKKKSTKDKIEEKGGGKKGREKRAVSKIKTAEERLWSQKDSTKGSPRKFSFSPPAVKSPCDT